MLNKNFFNNNFELQIAAILEENLRLRIKVAKAQHLFHNVTNLLQDIQGGQQLMLKICELNNITIEFLPAIQANISATVSKLAEYVHERSLSAKTEMLSINQLIAEIIQTQQTKFILQRIQLQTRLAENLPLIRLDKLLIEHVLLECLNNSSAAVLAKGPSGGCITVCTQLAAATNMVQIIIEDNGIGLTPEQQTNFFKPYYTTKPQGCGIGASINLVIVQQHGGNMTISGQPGLGCCVKIELPLQSEKSFNHDDFYAQIANLLF